MNSYLRGCGFESLIRCVQFYKRRCTSLYIWYLNVVIFTFYSVVLLIKCQTLKPFYPSRDIFFDFRFKKYSSLLLTQKSNCFKNFSVNLRKNFVEPIFVSHKVNRWSGLKNVFIKYFQNPRYFMHFESAFKPVEYTGLRWLWFSG